jgi:mRNA interferase RelE/StbE
MIVLQSSIFARTVKRLTDKDKEQLDGVIRGIMDDPETGVEKKGDLRGVRVHKFKLRSTHFLLAYRAKRDVLELIMLGPHENYYRDLKKYLRR